MDNGNNNNVQAQDMEAKKAQAEKNVRESLELAKLLADEDLFNPEKATACHKAIIDALNALKLIEQVQRKQAQILKAQQALADAMAKLGF